MPPAGLDSGSQKATVQKEALSVSNGPQPAQKKKKKRLRIRVRPKNKRFREAAAAAAAIAVAEDKTSSTTETESTSNSVESSPKKTPQAVEAVIPRSVVNESEMKSAISKVETKSDTSHPSNDATTKTREQVMAEREAKKLAKQQKKSKTSGDVEVPITNNKTTPIKPEEALAPTIVSQIPPSKPIQNSSSLQPEVVGHVNNATGIEKSREQIQIEREAKKQAKHAAKLAKGAASGVAKEVTEQLAELKLTNPIQKSAVETTTSAKTLPSDEKKKPVLSKAERRAVQEAQRAAKAQALTQKTQSSTAGKPSGAKVAPTPASKQQSSTISSSPNKNSATITSGKSNTTGKPRTHDCKVGLFNHLQNARRDVGLFVNDPQIHPSIVRLGEQYAQRTVVGSNARCVALLNALKQVVQHFETPPKKAFSRSLESAINACVDHLQKCRPLAVSMINAHKHIKHMLTQLQGDLPEAELKESVCHFIDTYIENQIGKAALAISSSMQEKITSDDVILTYGCSSLIHFIFEQAQKRGVAFRVIVVDSQPFCEGQEMLRRLTAVAIPCTYVLINAISFVMPEVTKVLLGAHALLANGYVMGRVGTAQVALVAQAFNVPVLVCCETHKFSERSQTDAIVYNELGNPQDLVKSEKCSLNNWEAKSKMTPLNLIYDVTPPELVTAVVTEVSILPCTSVPVILRIKPTEIGY